MFDALKERGFLVETLSHAWAILSGDFPDVASEIEEILLASTIPIEEIVGSGGGETKARSGCAARSGRRGGASTTSSSSALSTGGRWRASVMKWTTSAQFPAGTVALEIEWNNKDPFFDRDFENFKRLHADGAISLGVMVTRGPDLQDRMHELVRRFADERGIDDFEGVRRIGLTPTPRQIRAITKRVERLKKPVPFRQAWVDQFVSDKFGAATTHWRKLEDRVRRGVGNPCPLVLIGLPASIVTFGEDPAEVEALLAEGEAEAVEPPSIE